MVGEAGGTMGGFEHVPRVQHPLRERGRLGPVHAAKINSHRERRHLIVWHVAADVSVDQAADLVGGEGRAVALAGNDLDGVHLYGPRNQTDRNSLPQMEHGSNTDRTTVTL